eukprot:CAMPEP_0206471378 /NCGR_PEP_ID=MMETSP0324_2-20121206/31526_1 /ASSEMBLY_ACC=CAM_ASM_000836 /TAXON_ID=2866 /ORGANISM="Crypthecodinium cohnii, Strain Seligo" /LENGTH=64 /DNA_ID=CAMNT_0053945689 /DNA_START=7 /DNA_END=200 /DNA_ORIENTATION=+
MTPIPRSYDRAAMEMGGKVRKEKKKNKKKKKRKYEERMRRRRGGGGELAPDRGTSRAAAELARS